MNRSHTILRSYLHRTTLRADLNNSSSYINSLNQVLKRSLHNFSGIVSTRHTQNCKSNKKYHQILLLSHDGQFRRWYASYPPYTSVALPALSPTMEMGTIISWEKKEGDKLNEGDLLAEIETDKATMGFETPEEGYLAKILIPGGSKDIPVGKLVCIIVPNSSDIAAFKDFKEEGSAANPAASPAPSAPVKVKVPSATYPLYTPVALPALSPTMEMGTIISWEKKEGDKLNEGDLLAEIETDKATMGLETPEEGYLAKILIPGGSKDIPVGKLMCIIVPSASDIAAFKDFKEDAGAAAKTPSATPPPSPVRAPTQATVVSTPPPSGGRTFVSPFARALAAEKGLDLAGIGSGSGFGGSITSKDLSRAPASSGVAKAVTTTAPAAGSPGGSGFFDTPVSGIRGVIAKRLLLSKQTIPHYYLTAEIEVDLLMKLREQFNKTLEKEKVKLSINDFIIKASAMACLKVPEANSSWLDKVIRQYTSVDVSVAVSTPNGLITPIVFSADSKGVIEISENVKELAGKARSGKLQPHEFQGGTFTVSNLGMYGVHQFCAIINPPQSCILAIGGTSSKVVPADNEKGFKPVNVMYVTLSCDHRTVDGAVGAQWLQQFKLYLSNPASMIL